MKQFRAAKESLGDLDPEAAAALIAAAADVTLVVDRDGVIQDLAFDRTDLALEHSERWLGRPWTDTVTVESRPKVEALLRDAAAATPRWRQVNHPAAGMADVPILYSAFQIGEHGRIVALGRDLRAMASLQQRLVEAQQSMERDYARLRHVETRYRLLFQMASEPVLIIDAASQKVMEANPAADGLLTPGEGLQNRPFPAGFDGPGTLAVQALLAGVRASGRPADARVRLADGQREVVAYASLLRQEQSALFLVRLSAPDAAAPSAVIPHEKALLLEVMENAPDGIVVSDTNGLVLIANVAFLDLAQLTTPDQVRGESLDRWLGRPGVDLNVLATNLRQHGSVRLFATTLRGEYGAIAEVEICAVAVPGGRRAAFGFLIRDVGRRLAREPPRERGLPRSVEQLTELVGRVPLKDLVRETTDVIERLCIEAALDLTGDNRASAAEMLGLSRQSLYVKLRRYGLGDLEPEA